MPSHLLKRSLAAMRWLLLVFVLVPGITTAQPFEGVVVYQVSYTSKSANVSDAQLVKALGTHQTYSVKGGRYRNDQDGLLQTTQIYDPTTNRLYNKVAMSPTWFWTGGETETDTVVRSTLRRDSAEVLGIRCHARVFTTWKGTKTVFYAADGRFPYDVRAYRRHRYGLFYATIQLTRAVPLRIVFDGPELRFEMTAVSIEPRALSDAVFALPEGAAVEPAPKQ